MGRFRRTFVFAVIALAVTWVPAGHPAPAVAAPHVAPLALDVNSIFGDENEPDENENEPDGAAPAQQPSEADQESDDSESDDSSSSSRPSTTVLLVAGGLLPGLAVLATLIAIRIVRRIRRWTRRQVDGASKLWDDIVVRVPEVRGRRRPPS